MSMSMTMSTMTMTYVYDGRIAITYSHRQYATASIQQTCSATANKSNNHTLF